jgi:hypothetical protein
MSSLWRIIQQSSLTQRLFALVLAGNILLIAWGLHVVPAVISPNGIATTLASIGMQVAIACLAFFGFLSFQRLSSSMGIVVLFAALFALAYDGLLVSDFLPSSNLDFNAFLFFIAAPTLAGFIAGYQSGRFGRGVVVAFWALVMGTAIWSLGLLILNYATWGSHNWYFFWQNDGAIDDCRHSGATNLQVCLLQDMQGALFFHPLLSAAMGAICGLVASGVAQAVRRVRTQFVRASASYTSPGRNDGATL